MSLVNFLLILLVIVPAFSWVTTFLLIALAKQRPFITALTERAFSATFKSVGSTIIALLVLNSYLHWFDLQRPWNILVIGVALLLLEIPALVWLLLYLTDRFGR